MKNLLTICAFIFLNFLSLGQCGYLDDYYVEPRIYIQNENYTINLFPIIIPLAAFTLGKIIQFRVCRVITNPAGSVIFR